MANLKGSINFGLVHIPVEIATAEQSKEVSFRMLDSKDHSRIRFKRVSEQTGKEVEWDDIVKGYEYQPGEYVTFSDAELKELAAESNKSIDIESFVDRDEISPIFFETPYYLVPGKGGEKGYVVLERVLAKTGKFAVVHAVLRTKEHVGVVFANEGALMLGLLRYQDEVKRSADVLPESIDEVKVSDKEVAMAERLVKEMSGTFEPTQYKDHYAEKLQALIDQKISGAAKGKKRAPAPAVARNDGKVVDMIELLKRSMDQKAVKSKPKQKKRA